MLEELIDRELVDHIALGVKAPPTWNQYKKVVGIKEEVMFKEVLKSIELLKHGKVDYEFRTTLAPRLLNSEDIITTAERLKEAKRYVLQQFIPRTTIDKQFERLRPWPREKLEKLGEKIKDLFQTFELRNI